jgi:ribosome biogenesis protein ENP2
LPKVNKHLAERLLEESSAPPGKSSTPAANTGAAAAEQTNPQNPIGDDRFAALFTNPDYEVDEASEEYQLLHPVLTHREKRRAKKKERQLQQQLEQLSMEATKDEVMFAIFGSERLFHYLCHRANQ